ncbi:MAG: cytochrome ubiquinol oxidase subunit I [Thermodesulfobacteriota bacterium]
MEYPVWELAYSAGGLHIAIMAVVHVFIAHFAIGGGLFLVLTEKKAYRENSQDILNYVRRHTKFFLILTMVFGALTGVGIWFTISLISPAATSRLIHTFVFAWAIEWVFFLVEIVALFIYFYTFGKMQDKNHLRVGWIYFAAAWLSLFMINGILAFMLTPGQWLQTGNFWHGFFNPTFWPSLFLRTFLALVLAGVYGFVTSAWIKQAELRETLVRYCAKWLLAPFVFLLLSGYWYLQALPEAPREMILGRSPELMPFLQAFLMLAAILFLGGLLMALRLPGQVKRPMALILMLIAFMFLGSFEWLREGGRRPYVLYGQMYSNSIDPAWEGEINSQGILSRAKWTKHQEVTAQNQIAAGQEVYQLQCASCHSLGGPMNDIQGVTAKFDYFGLQAMLTGLGKVYDYMPRFMGTAEEKKALASYLLQEVQGKSKQESQEVNRPELDFQVPEFDPDKDEYVLLAWSNLGLKCITDCDSRWSLLPPGNTILAQLVRRDYRPEIVTQDVQLRYQAPEGFENPARHVEYWDYAQSLAGKDLEENVSAKGLGMSGKMKLDQDKQVFVASGIPVVPFSDQGEVNPYPLFDIEAVDKDSGEVLARTKVVAPVSSEVGCRNCHSGKWRVDNTMGISTATADDVLELHDKRNDTDLLQEAKHGDPVLCQSCHSDPLLQAEGRPDLLNLPAALHGFHANYLSHLPEAEACNACHPSSTQSYTDCMRGQHASIPEVNCTSCHGSIEDHALSLLKKEEQKGVPGAKRLMRHLEPNLAGSLEEIKPRTPWQDEPDCLSCHQDFQRPEDNQVQAFNQWAQGKENLYQNRTDNAGLMCQSCHGPTHAEYPAQNSFAKNLDNIQPLQYQGDTRTLGRENCTMCHLMEYEYSIHHENMVKD